MPCLNEAETVGTCIDKAIMFLRRSGINGEILVADNGSSDGSQEVARRSGARVVDVQERGYGSALIAGIEKAHGAFVIMGDADDSYDFSQLDPFVDALRHGADLAMGNRFKGGIEDGAMPWLHRYLGNPILSFLGRRFFGADIGDFHCGLRGFRRSSILALGLRSSGMEFASEMVVKAQIRGLQVVEVPTTLSVDGRSRAPHLRTWRDGWRHLRFLLLHSPRWLFLYPGALLLLIALALGTLIEITTVRIGSATFGVDTLVVSGAFFVVGLQSLFFALFTKVYGEAQGLLPPDPRLTRLRRPHILEVGVLTGLVVCVSGTVGLLIAFFDWRNLGFGQLNPVNALRLVVPSATLLVAGCQILFGGLFLSVLNIESRDAQQQTAGEFFPVVSGSYERQHAESIGVS